MHNLEIRSLRESDVEALVALRRVAFLDDTDYARDDMRAHLLSRLSRMSGAFLGPELVAAGSMHPFTMYYAGSPKNVGGLASVVSAAEHRRKGHVRALLASMLSGLRDEGVAFCLEYPFDPAYYAKFGWQTIPSGALIEVPPARLAKPSKTSARLVKTTDSTADAHIEAIYAQWARRFNFSMTRDGSARDDWRGIRIGPPWCEPSKTRFTYALDEAYCVLYLRREKGRGTIGYVEDAACSTTPGKRELLSFLAGLAGQVELFRMQLPQGDPTLLDLTPYLVAHPHPLQARIVDVRAALSGLHAAHSVDLRFTVTDDFCPWNQGSFHLTTVGVTTQVTEVSAEPASCIDIRDLTLLLADQASAAHLPHLPPDLRNGLAQLAANPAYMPLADYF